MKKILSIDDEPMILKCIEKAVHRFGYALRITTDPEEGLRIIRDDKDLTLVMLDVRMPVKDGFQIFREFRQFRHLPVLFVTAYPKSFSGRSDELVEMWRNEFADGTTDIIYKPFEIKTLLEKIEGLIGSASESPQQEGERESPE